MKAILADINIQGHLKALLSVWEGEDWRDLWSSLNLNLLTFPDLDIEQEATDEVVWLICQREHLILLTANRNAQGPDSLEQILRTRSTSSSLPVFTIANAQRVLHSRAYAERVAIRFLEYLLDIDRVRGVGRIYLP